MELTHSLNRRELFHKRSPWRRDSQRQSLNCDLQSYLVADVVIITLITFCAVRDR